MLAEICKCWSDYGVGICHDGDDVDMIKKLASGRKWREKMEMSGEMGITCCDSSLTLCRQQTEEYGSSLWLHPSHPSLPLFTVFAPFVQVAKYMNAKNNHCPDIASSILVPPSRKECRAHMDFFYWSTLFSVVQHLSRRDEWGRS